MDIRNFFGPRSTAKKSKPEEKTKSTSKDEVKVKTKEDTVKAKEKSKDRHRSKSKDEEKSKGRRKSSTENEDNNNIREKEKRKTKEIEDSSPKKKVNERKHKKDDVPKEKTPKKSEEVNGNRHSHSKRKAEQVSSDEDIDIQVTKKARKSKKMKPSNIIYDSDSDEESPVKEKKKKKRDIVVFSDSDEDDHIKKEKTIEQAFSKVTTPKQSASKKRPHEEEKKKTPISAADFFGAATVKRTDSKSSAKKKQIPQEVHEDMEIHDDSDFEDTLRNLDDHDFKAKKVKREETRVEEKVVQPSSNSGSSFASKLAGRLKGNVPETPDKKTSPHKSPAKVTAIHETPQTKTKSKQSTTPPAKSPAKVTPKKTPPFTSEKKVTPEKGTSTSPDDKTPLQRSKSSYRAYLHREGPKALGSKEIPQGADNCLEGLTFVITGVLESVERDEAKTLVERYGGKVTGSISKKTSYIVIGRDPGESKTKKAEGFGTKVLDEDGLFNLIRTLPGKRSKYEIAAEAEVKKELKKKTESKTPVKKPSVSTPKKEESLAVLEKFKAKPAGSPRTSSQGSQSSTSSQKTVSPKKKESQSGESLLWVDKYKPQSLKNIIGQQGDKSCAKKLLHWLNNWHRNRAAGKKPVFSKFNDDGSGHKAALLSGPPGVGKTTTATLVCKEAGYSFVELNASDTRSKKSLETTVSEALNNHTLVDYMGGKSGSKEGQKHCLVMDEVDGMAGNEDRGGVQELIALIKNSKIPIICMCNDRQHQKIRSLANYCFDLRFQRPRVEQIKAAMMSIAYREGLKLPPNALNEIIGAANQDVRQVIHNLSMWSAQETSLTYEQLKADAKKAKKDMKLGPFDVCRKVFVGGEETAGMSIHDKTELFFHDYSIGPLFVQENYPFVTPYAARGDIKKHLDLLSRTADSLAQADIFEKSIRGGSNWSLLPVEAIFATVYPGDTMRGSIGQMINFPSWLGKNSTRSKNDRILQELKAHMRLNMCGDKRALNMDYLPHMKHSLTRPLIRLGQEGVPEVIQIMDEYDLVREDVDNILEVSKWPNEKDLMSLIDSKVKSAFTRTYNKEVHMTPYSTSQVAKKGKRGAAAATYEGLDELGEEGTQAAQSDQEDDDDDVTADAMIKQKKPGKKGKTEAPKKGKAAAQGKGQSKGQGKGKGRGKK